MPVHSKKFNQIGKVISTHQNLENNWYKNREKIKNLVIGNKKEINIITGRAGAEIKKNNNSQLIKLRSEKLKKIFNLRKKIAYYE